MIIPYREKTHGSFDEEWLPHHKCNDWWYITGYLRDIHRPDSLYSYQFTVINPRHLGKVVYVLHLAFTDMQTGEHFFTNVVKPAGRNIGISQEAVTFLPFSRLQKNHNNMILTTKVKGLELNLNLNLGKGALWHCDNGVLVMGLPDDPLQRTVYYSYTNMPTSGSIKLTGGSRCPQEVAVIGKSWFDRQWGPFHLFHVVSFWEWFSIRFFDNEEVMLFAFPQHPYYDGTFIDKEGKTRRILDYRYNYHALKQKGKLIFSYGWDIWLPGIKSEKYRILPMNEGQYNNGYYEMMARVTATDGTEVGYCFVELLPGIRQNGKKFNRWHLLFGR